MNKISTIKDVARHAGVSVATVSNVLNERETVNREIVRRVREAVEILGYKRHQSGFQLKTKKSSLVNVILPSVTDPHFSALYIGAERVLGDHGYTAALHVSSEIRSKENELLEMSLQQRAAGVLIATCQPDDMKRADELREAGIQVVCLEREPVGGGFTFIEHDLRRLLFDAGRSLLHQGYRNIVLLTGPKEYSSEERAATGFLDAVAASGSDAQGMVLETNHDPETAFRALVGYISRGKKVDLVISTSSAIHRGARKALQLMASELKGHVRLVSLAEESWSDVESDDRLVIRRSGVQLGAAAAEALLDTLRNPIAHGGSYRRIAVPTTIGERKSAIRRYGEGEHLRVLMFDSMSRRAISDLLPHFEDRHGAKVTIEAMSAERLHAVLSDPAKRAQYDIVEIDQPWMSELASAGAIMPLNTRLKQHPELMRGLVPGVMDANCRYADGYFALPSRFDVEMLFFRKDLFDDPIQRLAYRDLTGGELRPPETWREFNAVARFFTRSLNPGSPTLHGTSLGTNPPHGTMVEFLTRLWGANARVLDDAGRVTLDSREAIEVLENYVESTDYAAPGWQDKQRSGQVEDFATGDVAMVAIFCAPAAQLTDRSVSRVVGKIGYAPVPGGVPVLGGWSMGIIAECPRPDLAFDWMSWAAGMEMAIPLTIMGGSTPALALYNSLELRSVYPWLGKAVEYFPKSRARAISLTTTGGRLSEFRYEQIVGSHVHRALRREVAPAEALGLAAAELRTILGQ
ncbi:extracellular solute-binding protein [Rhizobium rhizoryzae]|uniref:DNA-binding LacI/PurR family transcriptional regulator/ABC-type glycerol-3-phosphate transport system substrate-binding protein n=1 Tax=Rhizobium rhizoryzae TaxID=451876 RepID=A0A7W6LJX6_9HYPH|nr:extracellular solute-binding protein [Rhizobium rhizoryzae]MBB4145745.1 DNA-binding LacI/PurR family transcriptional regulator/ABC-type glycerol-3-phosphate transport system substrate-binding protein [Rhizobium rhizoryzae]